MTGLSIRRGFVTGAAGGVIGLVLAFSSVLPAAGSGLFLQVGDIRGESIDREHEDWLEGLFAYHGVVRLASVPGGAGGGTAALPKVQPLTVTRHSDAASPRLFAAVAAGERLPEVTLEWVRQSGDSRRLYRVFLEDVVIQSWRQWHQVADEVATEELALNYRRIEVTFQDEPGDGRKGSESTAFYDVETQESGTGTTTTTPGGGGGGGTPNLAPIIYTIASQSMSEDDSLAIPFAVSDDRTPAGDLAVSVSATPVTLFAASGLVLGGAGNSRSLTVTPVADASGLGTITITASDGARSSTRSFEVTVQPVNDPPSISFIPPQVTAQDVSLEIPIQLSDVDHAAEAITVTAAATDPSLVAPDGFTLSGTGSDRILTVSPATGQAGATEILVTARDGIDETTLAFSFVINAAPPSAPTDIQLSNSTVLENAPADTVVGGLSATDPDSLTHTFTIVDSAGGRFSVVDAQLRFTGALPLDFEQAISHTVLVRASDAEGFEITKALMVEVVNVNEAPAIAVSDPSPVETFAGVRTSIIRFQVSDPDAGLSPLQLTLSAVDGALDVGAAVPPDLTVEGVGTIEMILTGPVEALNEFLGSVDGLIYTAPQGSGGLDLLTATVTDQGFTGVGQAEVAAATLGLRFYIDQYNQWEHRHFTDLELADLGLRDELWAYHADADQDGGDNLFEYGSGTDPRVADADEFPRARFIEFEGSPHLWLEVTRRQDPNLTLVVGVASEAAGGVWSVAPADLERGTPTDVGNGFEQVTFRDTTSFTEAARRFFRIQWVLEVGSPGN